MVGNKKVKNLNCNFKRGVSYLSNNSIIKDCVKDGLTPLAIYQKLKDLGIINPNTNKPYSLMTVKRQIILITGDSIRAYITNVVNRC